MSTASWQNPKAAEATAYRGTRALGSEQPTAAES